MVGIRILLIVSMGRWAYAAIQAGHITSLSALLNFRNEFPLGHSNHTAGLALLILPWCGFKAWRAYRLHRAGWTIAAAFALAMLFTSGSRGGLIGLIVLALVAVIYARVSRRVLVLLTLLTATLTLAFAYAHPRTRALIFSRSAFSSDANLSNVQRSAMAMAGGRMGMDRPLLGWGPGTTPLVYPRYRAGLDGGVENAFQLHSTPIQLWADLGIGGCICAIGLLVLTCLGFRTGKRRRSSFPTTSQDISTSVSDEPSRSFGQRTGLFPELAPAVHVSSEAVPAEIEGGRSHPLHAPAMATLAGYGAFALTDYQLDVPIFTFAVAGCMALIARNAGTVSRTTRLSVVLVTLATLGVIGIWGRRDQTPEMNVRALALGKNPASADVAISLLNASLALNPHQEIAHFNLGWLLVIRDPAAAERHFLAAAHLVPDKGGVYFGLALSRLNQGRPGDTPAVVRGLALECLNDPRFLISPWWRQRDLAGLREQTITELNALGNSAALRLAARNDRRSREADFVAVLGEWLDGQSLPGEILRRSHTSERVSFFAGRPPLPDWKNAPVVSYRRERTAYPILARNMDLPPPVDLYDVQENSLATGELAWLFPAKGWLPSPLLLQLLSLPMSSPE